MRIWLAVILVALPLSADAQETSSRGIQKLHVQANRRIAICIGINHYADHNLNSLRKAANDAYGLAAVLEKQGDFKTYVLSDMDSEGREKSLSALLVPTKRQIEEFLGDAVSFGDIKQDDLVVFAFSGHGISDAKQNGYLLPLDWDSADPYRSAISVASIIDWLQTLGVTKSLILIDACREEMTTSRSLDTIPRLYAEKFLSANLAAAFYATEQGGFSYEDPQSIYGAFTRFLIEGLRGAANKDDDAVVTFRELSAFVEDGLGDWALKNGYKQRPYTRIFGEQSGDLALTVVPRPSVPVRVIPAVPQPQPVKTQSPKQLDFFITSIGIKMMPIPGGTFRMGSNVGDSDEKPLHIVTLSAFEMSATEITQGQYMAVMGTNPSKVKGDDNLPVENVSWEDAVAFCRILSQKTGGKFGLPTEAEWEYAGRAGTETKYYTGDDEGDLASAGWYYSNSGFKTHPVGQKAPNAWGLYDMHGNVWEWCADSYGKYTKGSEINPSGPLSVSDRVLRGGGWSCIAEGCRSADRGWINPSGRGGIIGFRIVRRP